MFSSKFKILDKLVSQENNILDFNNYLPRFNEYSQSPNFIKTLQIIFHVKGSLRVLINTSLPSLSRTVHVISIYNIQYSTVQYSTVQYSTVQFSTVQYNTVPL